MLKYLPKRDFDQSKLKDIATDVLKKFLTEEEL